MTKIVIARSGATRQSQVIPRDCFALRLAMTTENGIIHQTQSCTIQDSNLHYYLVIRYNINMLSEYIFKKLKEARYKLLKDGTYFGEIPGLRGVWANAKTLEDCRTKLQEVLEDWIILKMRAGDPIPGLRVPVATRRILAHA